jgi:hypothetical protein
MRNRILLVLTIFAMLLVITACAKNTTVTSSTKATAAPLAQETGYPKLFNPSSTCAGCHHNLQDSQGNAYSIFTDWSTSMHASAARDPYFLAAVRAETIQHKELAGTIEATCATCHMPMARTTALAVKEPVAMFDSGFLDANHPLNKLGTDGISCQLCHQIQAQGFGSAESYNGGYVIDLTTPAGERPLFGPFKVSDATIQLKKAVIGSLVTQSSHVKQSELCAICHTLHTRPVDAQGNLQEKPFPEQVVYLEWQNSQYAGGTSCQNCHMPEMQTSAVLANTGGLEARQPVFRHTFVGANSFMIDLVAANKEALKVSTDAQVLQSEAQNTRDYLREQAAGLSAKAARDGSSVTVTVQVDSRTGHKLPSAYPSRRAWLHLTIQDASGKTLFESGQYGPDGKIIENDNDQDAARYEPHYDRITGPDQVQIYEAILGNTDGAVTTELLRASQYLKDNRLLPKGFDKTGAVEDIRVMGEAAGDSSFNAGGDTVTYAVDLPGASGPLTVTVELLYQSIGYRWAENVRGEKTAESEAFLGFIAANPPLPVLLADTKVEIPYFYFSRAARKIELWNLISSSRNRARCGSCAG